ncbi:hypothetical protein PoB_004495800 [Plakobranchus ocellatus]|uniref:Uncharacterized protein n=1 Tax=Plakobranchus ocellatus TaxID=259542 RepID=A0AAV4BH07_9GAST|nr:hypothetical protein PoB_004495800 [Plakobranchus ocellatus]
MQPILDREGNIRVHPKFNFPMSKAIPTEDLMNIAACKWLTPASILGTLDPTAKMIVNKLKDFCNTAEVALFNHMPVAEPQQFCMFRKPEHLHLLLRSTQQHIRDVPKYRVMERILKANQCDLHTRKVITNESKVYAYCVNDPEKTFLGCNSKELLFDLNSARGSNAVPPETIDCETIQSEENTAEPSRPPPLPIPRRKRTYMQMNNAQEDDETEEDDDAIAAKYMMDSFSQPQKRPKALQNLDAVKKALTKFL